MFGYVNANRVELSDSDQIEYQRYYCGLCQQLHSQYSFKGQLLLNYDLAFMTILLSGLYEPKNTTKQFRCIIHPFSKKHAYINETTEYAAAMDILLSYYSLMDKFVDDGSIVAKNYANLLYQDFKKASEKYPKQADAVAQYIDKLSAAEQHGETNIDIISNYTGECLSILFCYKDDIWAKDLSQLGFYLGKFIYIMDAYDDLYKDEKKGQFNPLLSLKRESPKEFETFVRTHLTSLMAECAKSFERLPIVENADILRNILYSGVWTKYEYLRLKRQKKTSTKE